MKQNHIIFTGPSVRAIIDGIKTQSRRVVELPNEPTFRGGWRIDTFGGEGSFVMNNGQRTPAAERPVLYNETTGTMIGMPYDVGDTLWVKETWQALHQDIDFETGYADDIKAAKKIPRDTCDGYWVAGYAADTTWDASKEDRGFAWRSPLHMPRWASRIDIEITDLRFQRLQDISEDDARAEGVAAYDGALDEAAICHAAKAMGVTAAENRAWFAVLWDHINGRRKLATWSDNPFVRCLTFKATIQETRRA